MGTTRVGVLGAGGIGAVHARIVADDTRVKLVAVCDLDIGVASAVAARHGSVAFSDWKEFFAEIDVAIIAIPHHLHADAVEAAAAAGCDVLLEKPMAVTTADSARILAARERYGIRIMVGHPMRFAAPIIRADEILRSGDLGGPVTVASRIVVPWGEGRAPWQADPARGGGVLYMWGSHVVDRLCWLLGTTVETVFARVERRYTESIGGDDSVLAFLSFANGVVGTMELGGYRSGVPDLDTVIRSAGGFIRVSNRGKLEVSAGGNWSVLEPEDSYDWPNQALRAQWSHFIDSRNSGEPFAVSLDEAAHVVAVLSAALASSLTGELVVVTDQDGAT